MCPAWESDSELFFSTANALPIDTSEQYPREHNIRSGKPFGNDIWYIIVQQTILQVKNFHKLWMRNYYLIIFNITKGLVNE